MKPLAILLLLAVWVMGATGDARAKSPALTPAQIRTVVDTYAKSEVDNGSAIGIEVGIALGNKPPLFFSYGLALWRSAARPGEVH
jgi:hypothetical protein